jgi:predicted enzyme related to lactoylglutathione lyase
LFQEGRTLRIRITSIMVDNQEKALRFYTDVLGFQKKHDFPVGDYKWLTVVSPEGPKELEVDDIRYEYARLKARGVVFTNEPAKAGPVTIAVLSDTCGNLIELYQPA